MNRVARFFRSPRWQLFGKHAGRLGKRLLGASLDLVMPIPPNGALDALSDVRRVLLVRPNFRIGNTLFAMPLVPMLRARFPGARVDVLVGETTASLLDHLPIDSVHLVSRRFILRPWQFVALFRRLRRRRYDVAVDGGLGSFSGGLYAYLSGARHRIGCAGSADRFLTIRLARSRAAHVYDHAPNFARQLGATCADHPIYEVSADEAAGVATRLAPTGIVRDGAIEPFVALFVGGHLHKRWSPEHWMGLVAALQHEPVRWVVLLGPEEQSLGQRLAAHPAASGRLVPPGPLRAHAALLARAAIVVTPDSGTLHLAVALGRPTIALLQTERSLRFRPRGPADAVLMRPEVADVMRSLTRHAQWPRVSLVRGAGPGASRAAERVREPVAG